MYPFAAALVALTLGACGDDDATTASKSHGGGNSKPETTQSAPTVTGFDGSVPILMYHAIQPAPPDAALPDLFVPEAEFEEQMKWLDDHGYEGVTLDQVEDAWSPGAKLPPHPVVLTFDDGYLSQYVAAFPTLEHFHWPGVLNLVAKDADIPDADVKKMLGADPAWELASHTITHPDLTTLDSAELEQEVSGSRQLLQKRFGDPVDNFCYPAGRYDDKVIEAVKAAGYTGATTEVPGLATKQDPYVLDRIQILLDDGLGGFVSKLKAAEAGTANYKPSPGG